MRKCSEWNLARRVCGSHRARFVRPLFFSRICCSAVPRNSPYRAWADFAVCSEVLEHLDDPVLFLKNSAALMSPGCKLIVTVPGGPMSAFDKHIGHRRHFSKLDLSMSSGRRRFSGFNSPGFRLSFFQPISARGDSPWGRIDSGRIQSTQLSCTVVERSADGALPIALHDEQGDRIARLADAGCRSVARRRDRCCG